ncbi:ribosomal protein uS5 [Cardinium endosymbiont of Sogatella furcifera]|uniref:30S ribosomal protein S5 n=1 Tax=Cardinium endosymbiont of Sogatella furcifera TaxID=650378 RepID=UPI000E0DD1C6|nr:30S ribosomal protein S5 [Cardinium endosymbiont of Sogatella furcifera]AXI24507.1 ribosomal protein uS5 [Cardinium endosymbiont of Sogatella furcifera]
MILGGKKLRASDYNLEERVVAINRVTKVVEGGRRFSSSAVVVVGNGDGVVGYGLGKAKELTDAIAKGVEEAKRNLIKVPILRDTIPHGAVGKYGGGHVLLKPAASGTGVIAGGGVRIVLESVGIKNVLSKSQGSSNPHNVVKATFKALLQLRDPLTIAKQRGISLDQVFNG